jgi:AcrR family transcriptional regulator
MGINRPSMYAAFGDKEQLFRKALDRYDEGPSAFMRDAFNEPRARDAMNKILLGVVEGLSNPKNPKGCLLVQGALACSDESKGIRQELIERRTANEAQIAKRLKRAKAEGELPDEVNPVDLARFYVTVMRGLAVESATGASRGELTRVVETAMKAWPTK